MSDWTKAPVAASQEWEHIGTQLLATQASAVSFSGIAPLYRRFMVQGYVLFQTNGGSGGVTLRFNADATSPNYRAQYASLTMLAGGGTVFPSAQRATSSGFLLTDAAGRSPAGFWCMIQKVAATMQASINARAVSRTNNGALGAGHTDGHWVNTQNLINRIDLLANFGPGTRIVLAGARDSLT